MVGVDQLLPVHDRELIGGWAKRVVDSRGGIEKGRGIHELDGNSQRSRRRQLRELHVGSNTVNVQSEIEHGESTIKRGNQWCQLRSLFVKQIRQDNGAVRVIHRQERHVRPRNDQSSLEHGDSAFFVVQQRALLITQRNRRIRDTRRS